MRTGARIGRSFGVLLMHGSVIRNAERTANGTKQHYNPCVADDSAGCVSYADVQPHHRVQSVYIVREVPPHHKTRKKYIGRDAGPQLVTDPRGVRDGHFARSAGTLAPWRQTVWEARS
jgi:hypothetical protein